MADETKTAGTPSQDGGDAAATQTTGTPASDGRDAKSTSDIERLNLEWKAKAEKLNELERRFGPLDEALEQGVPAATEPAAGQPSGPDWAKVQQFAQQGDAVAAAQLVTARALYLREQLEDIDDPAERKATKDLFRSGRFNDINAARDHLRAQKADTLAEENRKLREQLEARDRQGQQVNNGAKTIVREVGAAEHKERMSGKEYDRKLQSLPPIERMALQRAYSEGKIAVEG